MAFDSMKVDLTDPKKDIELYGWQEVTSHRSFISNTTMLDPNGLFSEEIFGKMGTSDRKKKWGYIKLNDVFMNPHAYYVLSRLKRTVAENLKNGLGRYYVDKHGEIQSIDINNETVPADAAYSIAGTGFNWLKQAWPYIKWPTNKSMSNMAKIWRNFLRYNDINQIFWEEFLVMPAFYRDIDPNSNKRNRINTYYSKALRLSQVIKSSSNIVFIDDPETPNVSSAHIKLQDLLTEFYTFFMDKIGGTHGFANEHVLGKATDYGARLVISTPDFNVNHYTDSEADFFHSSVPLSTAINIFSPFIIYGITSWIQKFVSGGHSILYWDAVKSQWKREELDPTYMEEFNPDNIRKQVDLYKKSKKHRVEAVTLKGIDGKRIPITIYFNPETKNINVSAEEMIEKFDENTMNDHIKYITWCELFYIVAEDTLNGKNPKAIYNTRYPLTTFNNTYCSLMNIVPANKYEPIYVEGVLYKRYPKISIKSDGDIDRLFTDTMRMCSVYLDAMGADYDGDQISTQGLFSNEGNVDALKHMKEVSNVVGIDTSSIREFPHVVKHGLYGMTYKIPKPN